MVYMCVLRGEFSATVEAVVDFELVFKYLSVTVQIVPECAFVNLG